ncbi:MAG: DUF4198 domain-containing protein [Cytophagales bacterium]|nr:MAG: DUF4198 domain-containing protein [Cytophagales bacterium]
MNSRTIYLTASLVLGLTILAVAHEFWLQPQRFFAAVNDVVSIEIMVGEAFQGDHSEGKKNRIIQFVHIANGSKEDLTPNITNDHYGATNVTLKSPGTHMIAFANTPKFLSMKADSFLLYLQEDGLDNVIAARKKLNEADGQKRSRELYRRCVKTLIQVGDKPDNTFATNTGMPLEIIPAQNPYALKPGQMADFQVLFEQKPLPMALVRYWNRDAANQLHEVQQRSDAQGRVRFSLRAGRNMVSLVQMVPYTGAAQTGIEKPDFPPVDWISYWGSLTFGCK